MATTNNRGQDRSRDVRERKVFYATVGDDQCRFEVQPSWAHVVTTPVVAVDYLNYCEVAPTKPSARKKEIDFMLRTNVAGEIHIVGFLNGMSHKITSRSTPEQVENALIDVRDRLSKVLLANVTEPLTEAETEEHGNDFIVQQKALAAKAKPKAKAKLKKAA